MLSSLSSRQSILDYLASHGPVSASALAAALKLSLTGLGADLQLLLEEGLIRRHDRGYELTRVEYRRAQVRPEWEAVIVRHLTGRRDSARGVASVLRSSREVAEANCEFLHERGVLGRSSVGNLLLYFTAAQVR